MMTHDIGYRQLWEHKEDTRHEAEDDAAANPLAVRLGVRQPEWIGRGRQAGDYVRGPLADSEC